MKARNIKKALGIAMTTAMIFTMAMPAFAASTTNDNTADNRAAVQDPNYLGTEKAAEGTNKTIRINKHVDGHKYYLYQIFKGDIDVDKSTAEQPLYGLEANKGGLVISNLKWGGSIKPTDAIYTDMMAVPGFKSTFDTIATDAETNRAKNPARADAWKTLDKPEEIAEVLGWMGDDSTALQAVANVFDKYIKQEDAIFSLTGTGADTPITAEVPVGYYMIKEWSGDAVDSEGKIKPEYQNDALTRLVLEVVGNADANIKASTQTSDKTVGENVRPIDEEEKDNDLGSGDTYNDVADYNIGDDVPFQFIAPLNDIYEIKNYINGYFFIFKDTMSEGLTFNNDSVEVFIIDGSIDVDDAMANPKVTINKLPNGTQFAKGDSLTDAQIAANKALNGFEVVANDAQKFDVYIGNLQNAIAANAGVNGKEIKDGDKVVVRFTAKLNQNAEIGTEDGNPNTMTLVFSNNPNGQGTGETPENKVIVFTYELENTKYDQDLKELDGAQFKLYRNNEGKTEYVNLVDVTTDSDTVKVYVLNETTPWVDTKDAGSVIETKNGKFIIKGLDDGDYFLTEVKTPDGYNDLGGDIKVEIDADINHQVNWNGVSNDDLFNGAANAALSVKYGLIDSKGDYDGYEVTNPVETDNIVDGTAHTSIINQRGAVLPSTGGMGTTLFYAIGGVLLVGAAVLLVTRKRVEA